VLPDIRGEHRGDTLIGDGLVVMVSPSVLALSLVMLRVSLSGR
jgi:hypothetical protein